MSLDFYRRLIDALLGILVGLVTGTAFLPLFPTAPLLVALFGAIIGGLVGANARLVVERAADGFEIGCLGYAFVGGAAGMAVGTVPGVTLGLFVGLVSGFEAASLPRALVGILFAVLTLTIPGAVMGAATGALATILAIYLAPLIDRGRSVPQSESENVPPAWLAIAGWPVWPLWLMLVLTLFLLGVQGLLLSG